MKTKKIEGIRVGNQEFKINLFADDVTLLLKDEAENIERAFDSVREFGEVSGLNLNISKTEYQSLGISKEHQDPVTLLGVKICNNSDKMVEVNLEPITTKIENTLEVWKMRNISLLGRVHLVKSLCISLLMHSMAVLPNIDPQWYKIINTSLFKFIWKGGSEKIRRSVMWGPFELGGVNMTHLPSLKHTLNLKWIKKLFTGVNTAWKWSVIHNLTIPDLRTSFEANLAPADGRLIFKRSMGNFWCEVIQSWCSYNYSARIVGWYQVLNQPIWLNSHIRVENKPVFLKKWFEKGIVYVRHLVAFSEYRLISWEEFNTKFNVGCTFLQFYSIVSAIPDEWRSTVRDGPNWLDHEVGDQNSLTIDYLISQSHKSIYDSLVTRHCDIPEERFMGWDKVFNLREFISDEISWFESYTQCFGWTKSVELRSFEYRFRLRLLQPASRVARMGLIEDASCKRCGFQTEDLFHVFWECNTVRDVWLNLVLWFNMVFSLDIPFDPRTVLFNLVDDTGLKVPTVFWLCCLVSKKEIWISRCLNQQTSIDKCLKAIENTEKIEANIATKNRKIGRHRLKWGPLSSVQMTELEGTVKIITVETHLFKFMPAT